MIAPGMPSSAVPRLVAWRGWNREAVNRQSYDRRADQSAEECSNDAAPKSGQEPRL